MRINDTRFSYMKNTLFHLSCVEYPEVNYVFKSEMHALEHLREWFRIDYHNRDSLTYMIRIEVVSKETYKEIETDDC